ncbi:MAG: hypothetical protein LBT16_08940 [Treponema sp.]|nr:hypothetical protein [Treponema sp.]
MNKKLLFLGIPVCLLILGLALSGCDNGTTGSGAPTDEYTLEWGSFNADYATIMATIKKEGWNVQEVQGGTAGMATGATATAIYNYCTSGKIVFNDGGTVNGSFETLINYSNQGVSAPSELKTLLNSNKANVPLAGIFDGGQAAVVFYIRKK